ncbi:MAG: LOG family protein [Desulfomonile tiedjei]|uniref:LOG family protein n=1 Tax=Desulfomonile tiedjei TaxID=2358 RepID=A0A9D6Z533_9BACT|nr:LOG family protein [Desulfomonile tiedjei]
MAGDVNFKFAVLGSASTSEESLEGRKAYAVGVLVASLNGVLLTGGCPGLPHAAAQGARSVGGPTIAISPATNREEHRLVYTYPLDSEVILYTGMGTKGRNVILVRSADACVFIGGGMGTLNEFTIAFDDLDSCCAIGVLLNSGGYSGEFLRLAGLVDRSPRAALIAESDPRKLVEALFKHLEKS